MIQHNFQNPKCYLKVNNNQQTDPTKEYMANVGRVTNNDYSALPGGFNNWTDEAFYDWGLDKGYITESGIGGPQESKFPGWLRIPAQYMNDKKFQWWKDSAIERGLINRRYHLIAATSLPYWH